MSVKVKIKHLKPGTVFNLRKPRVVKELLKGNYKDVRQCPFWMCYNDSK